MSDVHQPLFALLEVMLNLATPKVNPGGYSEEMFLDLTEEEKEEFTCSICYQVLKDTRMCLNNHKYCYSCIFVWSTSGPATNHSRCPVCRADGFYLKNKTLDDRIGMKKVKCQMKSCRWRGPLRILTNHQHTTYTRTGLPMYRSESRDEGSSNNNELPRLTEDTRRQTRENPNSPRLQTLSELRQQASRSSHRLTQRSGTVDTSSQTSSESHTPRTPHPPNTPRPQGQPNRRVPTLPSIVHQNQNREPANENRTPRTRFDTRTGARPPPGHTNIRDRLRESRSRLDALMTNFTNELERGRREIEDFQEERERRRQEQLSEVRELGQRLGVVAQELRRLLTQRRQLREDLEDASESSV